MPSAWTVITSRVVWFRGAAFLMFVTQALVLGCSSSDSSSESPQAKADEALPLLASERLPAPPARADFVDGIAACSGSVGELDVFAVASDGAIWHSAFDDGEWRAWEAVAEAGTADTGVSASASTTRAIDLFYRDAASKRLGHTYLDADAKWQTERLGKSEIEQLTPTAASNEDGVHVFTRGPGATLLHLSKTDAWGEDWVSEESAQKVGSAPTAVASADGRLDVFWSHAESKRLNQWSNDGATHALDSDALDSAPAAASRATGLLDVVYLSGASTLVRHFFDAGWEYEKFRLPEATSVASVSWGPGRLDVFYLDAEGLIGHALIPSVSVLTQHNDNARTGGNTHELELNIDTVSSSRFGKLFTIPVDGNVWSQPLYRATVDLTEQGQGIRNALYVTTGNDSVYLFDADTGEPLAHRSLGHPVPVPFADFTTGGGSTAVGSQCVYNSLPQIGITSTPVLDPATNTLYVVALTADEELQAEVIAQCAVQQDPKHVYREQLHALDSRTLQERQGSPVTVDPKYEYKGQAIPFAANRQLQRSSLLLSQGNIYLAFGSYQDRRPYYGWVISYDAATLSQRDVWIDTPEGSEIKGGGLGGIWQSGQGLTADATGNVYLLTGNGPAGRHFQYANAAIELSPTLSVLSSFRPASADALDHDDLDFSSSGAMLVPDTHFVVGGGKDGRVYVMKQGNLGGHAATNDVAFEDLTAIPSEDCAAENGSIANLHSSVIYWKSATGAANLYLMGEADYLKKLELDEHSGTFSVIAQSDERAACGMPGGFLSVSSNGNRPKTAIVWANVPTADSAQAVVPANFYAYNAETLETLYRDDSRASLTSVEKFAKYVAPTVANGRVYQAAFGPADENLGSLNDHYSGSVVVYGLKSK